MADPYKPKRGEVYVKGAKVSEFSPGNSCNSFYIEIREERSRELFDCGRKEYYCTRGSMYGYTPSHRSCQCKTGSCWSYKGGNRGNGGRCGWKNWDYHGCPSERPVKEYKWRWVAEGFERVGLFKKSVGKWESPWLCWSSDAQKEEYAAMKPTSQLFPVEWCAPDTLICGNPCAILGGFCCLDCKKVSQKMRQLADAAESIFKRLY